VKVTRRRQRRPDPLASRAAVRTILRDLRAALPEIIPSSDRELLSLLRAILHTERHPEVRTRRGRKSKWKDYELEKTAGALRRILGRGTNRICLRSFTEHYLLIPGFPEEIAEALERSEINLFEAEQLARLTPVRLKASAEQARKQRRRLLRVHLQSGESGARLKARVDGLLWLHRHPEALFEPVPSPGRFSPEIMAEAQKLEAEIDAAADDPDSLVAGIGPDHFFYEYLRIIASMMREIDAGAIPDEALDRLMGHGEQLIQQLNSIWKQQHPAVDQRTIEETKQSFYL